MAATLAGATATFTRGTTTLVGIDRNKVISAETIEAENYDWPAAGWLFFVGFRVIF